MKTLVIIPAFNEEKSLVNVVGDLHKNASDCDYVIINDCSTDGTAQVCRDNGLNFISLPINLGIGGAMQTGYKYAKRHNYDVAIQFDGDGQHNAEYIAPLLKGIEEGSDMVIGSRYLAREGFQSSAMRRFGIKYFSLLIRMLTWVKVTDPTSGFRACNRRTIEIFASQYPFDYPEPEVIVRLSKKKHKISETGVRMNERKEGKSSITPFKSIYYMIKVTLGVLFAAMDR